MSKGLVAVQAQSEGWLQLSLRKLRNSAEKTPTFACDNCKCTRYKKCTCKRRNGR